MDNTEIIVEMLAKLESKVDNLATEFNLHKGRDEGRQASISLLGGLVGGIVPLIGLLLSL